MTLCSMPLGSNGGYICPGYMCILLYIKLFWCSGIPHIYDQLEEGVSSSDRYRSSENLRLSR